MPAASFLAFHPCSPRPLFALLLSSSPFSLCDPMRWFSPAVHPFTHGQASFYIQYHPPSHICDKLYISHASQTTPSIP
ncbi:hypothetical protein V8E52_003371 [Russula decolorans]